MLSKLESLRAQARCPNRVGEIVKKMTQTVCFHTLLNIPNGFNLSRTSCYNKNTGPVFFPPKRTWPLRLKLDYQGRDCIFYIIWRLNGQLLVNLNLIMKRRILGEWNLKIDKFGKIFLLHLRIYKFFSYLTMHWKIEGKKIKLLRNILFLHFLLIYQTW